jgi:hypothetical protein
MNLDSVKTRSSPLDPRVGILMVNGGNRYCFVTDLGNLVLRDTEADIMAALADYDVFHARMSERIA